MQSWDHFPAAGQPAPQPVIPRQAPPQTATQQAIDEQHLADMRRNAAREEGAPVPGDNNLTGDDYLRSLNDAALARQARALAEGRIPWPSGRAATDAHWQRIIAAAGQYDPTLDAATSRARQAAIQQFTGNGRAAQMIGSINRVANHLHDLYQASERLSGPELHFGPLNTAAAAIGQSFDPADLRTYNTALPLVADELEKIARNGTGSVEGIRHTIDNLSPRQSLETRRAAIREVVSLIHGAVEPLQAQYDSAFQDGTSRPPIPWVSPRALRTYAQIGGEDFSLSGAPPPTVGPATTLTVGGPSGGGSPPAGGGPIVPGVTPHAGSGTVSASSDTPPTQEVTAGDAGWTQEAQRMFDGGAMREQMDAFAARHGRQPYGPVLDRAIHLRDTNPNARIRILPPETTTAAGTRAQELEFAEGAPGFGQRARAGLLQGTNDEISGVASSLGNVLASPFTGDFDPIGQYQVGRDAERIRNSDAADRTGALGTALEFGSSVVGAAPLFAASAPAELGLGGRMWASGRTGAGAGAASGWTHGEGLGGSTVGAVEGAAGGLALGTAAPLVTSAVRGTGRLARGAYRLARGENPDLAPRTVAQAIADDANTPAGVGTQMQEAHANDVPYMLADTGDNARGMLAATARAPGAARTLTRDALRQRQEGLPERVTAAIERDLGPASNPHEIAAQLSAQARATAAPLYDAAYARPGAGTFAERMGNMLRRPSMQGALQRAQRIAAEEGRDPNTMGFDVNSSGEVTIGATPSWQTLDYVKRGMDDVIEQSRDSTTGKLNLNTEGHAINDTQRAFLQQFDAANSDYAAARAAYAGPTRANAAMQRGLGGRNGTGPGAMNMTADDISATINRMTPLEQEMFRLGHRRAMVEHVAAGGDHADMVGRLIGTGKRRAAIQRLYGDNENFPRFVSTLQAEQAGHQTYRQAMLGSQTAPNIQDDAALPGAATAALTDLVTTGGLPVATGIRQAAKLGVSRVSRNAQQQISTLLSENDPARISEFARVLQEHAAKVSAARIAAARRSPIYGYGAGSAVGSSIQDAYGQ